MNKLAIAVDPAHASRIQGDPALASELHKCATSFKYFLRYWHFRDQETGVIRKLGDEVWDGQDQLIEAVESCPKVFAFKARKLGFTTLSCAYDGWVARFRDQNGRVHLFSRRDDAAKELLEAVKFGLERLPDWMRLPYAKQPTVGELRLDAGGDDTRIIKAYPTGKETAVEATCTHGHVDEWARMDDPKAVWQAIEPSMAGSCHFITTGRGPTNYASIFFRKCLAGDTEFVPIFVDALARKGRDEDWLKRKRKGMTEQAGKQEFPMTPEDAMSGGGRFVFRGADVDMAGGRGVGPTPAEDGHRYVKSWDIGRHNDAAVGTVLDVDAEPTQVVHYVRLRGVPYPVLQTRIERVHREYPGKTVIEKNGPGEAVAENLDLPEHEVELFNTSAKSKAKILEELQLSLEQMALAWDANAWPQLDAEVRGYQIPDKDIVQDSVMSLAIGNAYVPNVAGSRGRLVRIIRW